MLGFGRIEEDFAYHVTESMYDVNGTVLKIDIVSRRNNALPDSHTS